MNLRLVVKAWSEQPTVTFRFVSLSLVLLSISSAASDAMKQCYIAALSLHFLPDGHDWGIEKPSVGNQHRRKVNKGQLFCIEYNDRMLKTCTLCMGGRIAFACA